MKYSFELSRVIANKYDMFIGMEWFQVPKLNKCIDLERFDYITYILMEVRSSLSLIIERTWLKFWNSVDTNDVVPGFEGNGWSVLENRSIWRMIVCLATVSRSCGLKRYKIISIASYELNKMAVICQQRFNWISGRRNKNCYSRINNNNDTIECNY